MSDRLWDLMHGVSACVFLLCVAVLGGMIGLSLYDHLHPTDRG